MPASADRSHLSIGEVLSLLQDEFPDVTISKIRFLESQGLLDPERTPSGYRKFYETDIERLRWILRQQKDNYLPLKVIKDRLDDIGQADPSAPHDQPAGSDPSPSGAPRRRDDAGGGRAATETTAVAPGGVEPHPARRGQGVASGSAPSRSAATIGERAVPSVGSRPGGSRRTPVDNGTPMGLRRGVAAAASTRPMRLVDGAGTDADPVSFTIDELAAASGLPVRDLRELEHFGLLAAYEDGVGPPSYDGDALVVARVAGGFLQHGIEARHLRSYRVAVDREAGLFQQIVAPLLKQRNPEAHRRAARTVTELMQLGEAMRAALLRHELRNHIDH